MYQMEQCALNATMPLQFSLMTFCSESMKKSLTSARVVKNNSIFTDTLVVFDTAEWFKPFSVTYVQCCDNGPDVSNVCKGMYNFAQTGVFLIGRLIIPRNYDHAYLNLQY